MKIEAMTNAARTLEARGYASNMANRQCWTMWTWRWSRAASMV